MGSKRLKSVFIGVEVSFIVELVSRVFSLSPSFAFVSTVVFFLV